MAKKYRFNLLDKKAKNIFGEVSGFLNDYARYIIVLTQLLVLVVFFVKIILDQSVIDLKEAIDQKNQIILTSKEMILTNNRLAEKAIDLNTLIGMNEKQYVRVVRSLNNIPKTVTLSRLSLTKTKTLFNGTTPDPMDIKRMQLRLSQKLGQNITVTKISKEYNVYNFEIAIDD